MRTWELVRETTKNIFYVKRLPFLHFHTSKEGGRWADARCGAKWGPRLAIPRDSSARERTAFAKEIERRHRETVAAVTS